MHQHPVAVSAGLVGDCRKPVGNRFGTRPAAAVSTRGLSPIGDQSKDAHHSSPGEGRPKRQHRYGRSGKVRRAREKSSVSPASARYCLGTSRNRNERAATGGGTMAKWRVIQQILAVPFNVPAVSALEKGSLLPDQALISRRGPCCHTFLC